MTIWQRIAREPNAILGVIVAGYGVLVAFGILELTAPQAGAVTALGGALVILLRWLVTPASEVVVQQKPGQVNPTTPEGTEVHVSKILGKA